MSIREEYPRPDFDRSHSWMCLNGAWDFLADPEDQGRQADWEQPGKVNWSQSILVPFAWESASSTVQREWLPVGWYRRFLERPSAWRQERTILHFGAVYYRCQVWVNGRQVGEHTGGYLPFSFDITDELRDGQGELVVRVEAPLNKLAIPHGKQRSNPPDDYDSCAFTASSGIWQSVWLESRPATFIRHVSLSPTEQLDGINASVEFDGPHLAGALLHISVEDMPEQVIRLQDAQPLALTLSIAQPQLWTPADPHLYNVWLKLESKDGVDQVKCYTGLRTIAVQGNRLLLNGERLYIRGALDQGYWPESGYTAPTDEALRQDVELALQAGYNLIRKHIKLEDPRWLYWADRLGLLVWAEPPCVGRYSAQALARFEEQLPLMVARDSSHPSIVLWGIYNEEWGLDWRSTLDVEKQEAVIRAYDLLAAHDHSRPIIDDSGWNHIKTDVLDWHYYDHDNRRWREITEKLANDASTWFGHELAVDRWYETQLGVAGYPARNLPLINGEYGAGDTPESRGWYLRWQTQELRRQAAMSGYIYTELYDVEHEKCGIYDAQREPKPLGCDPSDINAETVIIFDLMPQRPGLDYLAENTQFELSLQVSHHSPQALRGQLIWSWESEKASTGSCPLALAPYELTVPTLIQLEMPDGCEHDRLHIQYIDTEGTRRAYNFLDVAAAEWQRHESSS
ncbi:glycoside hydrolase family 2 [Ktedonosporobacter rubrisoli]|uniref:Glycoside hydrolase family 2 n=1 Tax=Ktedonosporobacter rubrisoli TaxID=2509675 RepID=A0A4P6JJ46_KTERU|nr:sugar-binding domain-containing protein [Ktedonosporobacter rubrisoli]QBD75108.1 glycoside hydrolase family 2 [Ktedonosporobacter rubrisoli]